MQPSTRRQIGRSRLGRQFRQQSPRAFYWTLVAVGALCLLSFVSGPHQARRESGFDSHLAARDIDIFTHTNTTDELKDCHLVRKAADKCAFVRAHCPDEEAGLFSYLEFYYCDFHHAKPIAFSVIVLWLGMLFSTIGIAASDFFCVNLSTIATILGMSESLAGVTFLAFGNGSPDVFSTFAAMGSKSGSLAVGELIGAAGFITAVVAGSMAMVRPFRVAKKSFVRDVGFFVVAAGFSLVFLKDGKLYLWECCLMVGFYVFYVVFVVAWHWWLGRQRVRRQTHALARDHYAHGADVEPVEEYHDDEDTPAAPSRTGVSRTTSANDLETLERGAAEWSDDISEVPEDTRERWLGEISNNMRLRPQTRRGTMNPIRPSLVGALEFRAVMAGLQKSRNIQTIPINLRRYSDDPNFTAAQQADQLSITSDPPARPYYESASESEDNGSHHGQFLDVRGGQGGRARAVSANGADGMRYDPNSFRRSSRRLSPIQSHGSEDGSRRGSYLDTHNLPAPGQSALSTVGSQLSIQVSITPPVADEQSGTSGTTGAEHPANSSSFFLLPSGGDFFGSNDRPSRPRISREVSPTTFAPPTPLAPPSPDPRGDHKSKTLELPKLQIPRSASPDSRSILSSPTSPFPAFVDDPHRLRPRASTLRARAASYQNLLPGAGEHAIDVDGNLKTLEEPERPPRWWPAVFPSPYAIVSALFPTLCSWREKNLWEKALGVVAAPSVFLLAITLPVVEAGQGELVEEEARKSTLSLGLSTPYSDDPNMAKSSITVLEPEMETEDEHRAGADGTPAAAYHSLGGHGDTATTAISAERLHAHKHHDAEAPSLSVHRPRQLDSPEQIPSTPTAVASSDDKDWNRWLLMIHCFTSPLFCVLIIYANFYDNFSWTGSTLLKMSLYTSIGSLAALALVITTSTPTRPPQWRTGLCFAGFCVSIAWISTVANEVVGVLKAVGVILNMSDAILGLTIFAVGNSLGDFVADVTVARIGFPVMALSACFGGPMLNILLGIGLSGMYFTIKHARDKQARHPDKGMKFKPFHVDVSGTLLISGATLLFTLIVLLVLVPARRWRMDRVVGVTIIVIWVLSTVANVVIEVLGYSDDLGPGLFW